MKQSHDSMSGAGRASLAAGVLCVLASAMQACAGDEVALSPRRYSDKLNGFTLTPPAEADQIRDSTPACLVRWVSRDPKTGVIAWTLGVNVAIEKDPNAYLRAGADLDANAAGEKVLPLDLKKYSEALTGHLKNQDGLALASADLTEVDGHGAIDIRGTTGRGGVESRTWRRQVWVLAQPGRFLVFWAAGPADSKDGLDRLLQAVLSTVKIVDPLEVLKAQEASLLRGRQFLAELRGRKFVPAEGLQWFAFRQDDKVVGFTIQGESLARRETHSGLELHTVTMLHLPKDQLRVATRVLFATTAGGDHWRETLQVGEGDSKTLTREEGVRQEGLVVCTFTEGSRIQTRKKEVPLDPNDPPDMYLPRAAGMIFPRLIDLAKPASYAFAVYSSADNRIKLRTFTVVGPEKITLGGRRVDAVRITDVEGADEEAASEIWVDAKGMPLRIKAPGWPVIEASTREEISSRLPEAVPYIEEAVKK